MNSKRYKIVLVDDNVATLNQGKNLLSESYQVYTFQSAITLFEDIEKIIPDLILLDVEMPEMDGFEAIKKLKANEHYKDIPVLFLTSRSDAESEKYGFILGAADYITKPLSGPLLLKRISTQILYKQVQNAIDIHTNNMEKLHNELTEANERLKGLHEAKVTVMRIISHDLKNYIGIISSATEMAQQLHCSNTKMDKYITTIDNYTDKAIDLIKDIVQMIEIETTDLTVDLQPVLIDDYLKNMTDLFINECEIKEINFSAEYQAGNPLVKINPDKMWQILNNLIHNAVKFTPRGGSVCLKTNIVHLPQSEQGNVVSDYIGSEEQSFHEHRLAIHIIDTGQGIAKEHIPNLFEKYSKARRKGTEGEESTGLGLSIVKGLLKHHNGAISVTSETGKGSDFCILLPLYRET